MLAKEFDFDSCMQRFDLSWQLAMEKAGCRSLALPSSVAEEPNEVALDADNPGEGAAKSEVVADDVGIVSNHIWALD